MSNRSSTSDPRPPSAATSSSSRPVTRSQRSPSSMIQVLRPSLTTTTDPSTSYSSYYTDSPAYPIHPPLPTASRQTSPPPDIMRNFDHRRGVKRPRSEDKSGDDDEDEPVTDSETDGNFEQAVLPAPKKRTRTLMTPDQLTSLHRLLSMTRFPTTEQREQCGREIGLSARRVQVWFQNQRQKSKAQQQAVSQAGSSRGQVLAPRSSAPYQVFSYDPRYETRPYTSPYSHSYDQPHVAPAAPVPRRSSRLGYHRRGTSSLSYPPLPTSAPHGGPSRGYPPARLPMEEVEFAHTPFHRYEPHTLEHVGGSHSPELSLRPVRDDHTLPPIWPGNDREAESTSHTRSPVNTSRPGPSRQALLPTGLPPPQPLEPTPLWNHPHTNPRYMRPLPPAPGFPSLLSSLNRERARSDPPVGSLPPSPQRPSHPTTGLGLSLTLGPDVDATENSTRSPERTTSDPIVYRPSRSDERESTPTVGSPRPQTARGGASHSRHSSRDSRDRLD